MSLVSKQMEFMKLIYTHHEGHSFWSWKFVKKGVQ